MFAIGSVKEDFLGSVVSDWVSTRLTEAEPFDPVSNHQHLQITCMHRAYSGCHSVSAWSSCGDLITHEKSGISNETGTDISMVNYLDDLEGQRPNYRCPNINQVDFLLNTVLCMSKFPQRELNKG